MQLSRQAVVSVLFVASILLGGILFWPNIFNEIITPAALVVWLFLRVFVLSIDQKYYWGAIIIIAFVFLLRLPPLGAAPVPSDEHPEANEAIETIRYWRSIFTLTDVSAHDEKILKQELVHLVAALYASKQRVLPGFLLYEALERGEIPLPDGIHAFLFPDEPKETGRSATRLLREARELPRKWIRRWKGQETAEYYRMIDETLRFVETSLEIESGNGKFTPNEN